MLSSFLLISCCLLSLVNTQNVQFKAIDSSGVHYVSSAAALEGSVVRLSCSYDAIEGAQPIVTISIKDNADDTWREQVACDYGSNDNTGTLGTPLTSTLFNKDNATCSTNILDVRLRVKNLPKYYQCRWYNWIYGMKMSEITLRSYIIPTQPEIKQLHQDTPEEGAKVEYSCESYAKPPPRLRFSYDGEEIPESELAYTPSLDSITDDSANGTSTVTWTSNATKAMNGKNLKCEIYDHLSKSALYKEHQMSVFYGPEDGALAEDWNLEFSVTKEIKCNMESNGLVTYRWFNSSSPDVLMYSSQSFELKKDDYKFVTKGHNISEVYICKAMNEDNNGKEGQLRVTVNIHMTEVTTTVASSTTTTIATTAPPSARPNVGNEEADGLEAWTIAVIVAALALVIIIIVVIIVLFRRKQNSPARKKKQAANKNHGADYRSQSGGKGLNSQPDIIINNYRGDDSTLPTKRADFNRYSHVEDFADAIDDKPRSRKPIAYSADELNGEFDSPPNMDNGPPGYQTHDSSMYRDYRATPTHIDPYHVNYGAPC